jgi:shikimate 5-dehydrogenase
MMRKMMRNAVLIAGAIVVCAGGTARASTSNVLEASVPFSFVVNGQTLPAGKYMVQRDDTSSSVLLIRGEGNNHASVFVSTTPDGGHDPAGSKPTLTFRQGENQYRLESVWESGSQGWDVSGR